MQPIGAMQDCPILPLTPPDFTSPDKSRQPAVCVSFAREVDCSDISGDITRACVVERCVQNPVSRAGALAVYEPGAASRLPEDYLESAERTPRSRRGEWVPIRE